MTWRGSLPYLDKFLLLYHLALPQLMGEFQVDTYSFSSKFCFVHLSLVNNHSTPFVKHLFCIISLSG